MQFLDLRKLPGAYLCLSEALKISFLSMPQKLNKAGAAAIFPQISRGKLRTCQASNYFFFPRKAVIFAAGVIEIAKRNMTEQLREKYM